MDERRRVEPNDPALATPQDPATAAGVMPDPDVLPGHDLTPAAADAAEEGVDVRRLTAGYDTGNQHDAAARDRVQRDRFGMPADDLPAEPDTGLVDTDTGMDFGTGGGRDVGSDVG